LDVVDMQRVWFLSVTSAHRKIWPTGTHQSGVRLKNFRQPGTAFPQTKSRTPEPTALPLQNAVIYTLICVVIVVAIFGPMAVSRYARTETRN
jgi:hypothetical protein